MEPKDGPGVGEVDGVLDLRDLTSAARFEKLQVHRQGAQAAILLREASGTSIHLLQEERVFPVVRTAVLAPDMPGFAWSAWAKVQDVSCGMRSRV